MAPSVSATPRVADATIVESSVAQGSSPLVFISHDTRDAALAEAFSNLLADASTGILKSFRSSDRRGTAGIDYGKEWYNAVMEALGRATDVVALLTQHSIGRPWILFEAGVAKGIRGSDSVVFGVTLGVPLEKAISGPFSVFQNSDDSEDRLTAVVMQLIRRVPNAEPREAAIRKRVQEFRQEVGDLLKHPAKASTGDRVDETAVAKLFEEAKVLFRDLPQQVENKLREMGPGRRRRNRRFHPMMLEEMLHGPMAEEMHAGAALGWLVFISFLRDDAPWLYELGMDVYRALRSGDHKQLAAARREFRDAMHVLRRGHPGLMEMLGGDEDTFMMLRHLPMELDHFLERLEQEVPARGKRKTDEKGLPPDAEEK